MSVSALRAALAVFGVLALGACTQGTSVSEPVVAGGQASAPSAQFTTTTTAGTAPLTVGFTDQSVGAVAWFWDFGDGGVSNAQSLMHTYATAGSFDVRLTVTAADGQTSTVTQAALITTSEAVGDATFESSTPGMPPGAPWTTTFGTTNVLSTAVGGGDGGMPSAGLQWCEVSTAGTMDGGPLATLQQDIRFPQGRPVLQLDAAFVSGEAAGGVLVDVMRIEVDDGGGPSVIFARDTDSPSVGASAVHPGATITAVETVTADLQALFPGSDEQTVFTLTIAARNGGAMPGNDSFAYVDDLRFVAPAPQPVAAAFMASSMTITQGSTVNFTDTSTGNPKSWSWDFGDGAGSTVQDPSHTYPDVGVFDVTLTVAAPGSSDSTAPFPVTVNVDPANCPSVAGFTAVQDPNQLRTVDFTAVGPNNVVDYVWDFGDATGTTVGVPTTTHTYAAAGTYLVVLDPDDANVACDPLMDQVQMMVTVEDPPNVTFTITPTSAYVGDDVTFDAVTNPGSGAVTTFAWDFENDGSDDATGSTVVHAYGSKGTKTVQLTATGPGGTDVAFSTIDVVPTWTQIFNASLSSCSDCHTNSQGSSTFSMTTKGIAHGNIVNVPTTAGNTACLSSTRVVPGNPNGSSFVESVEQSNACLSPDQMPKGIGGPNLSASEVSDLRDWVLLGAANN